MEDALKSQGLNHAITAVLAHAYALAGNVAKTQELLKSLPKDWGYYQRGVVATSSWETGTQLSRIWTKRWTNARCSSSG